MAVEVGCRKESKRVADGMEKGRVIGDCVGVCGGGAAGAGV